MQRINENLGAEEFHDTKYGDRWAKPNFYCFCSSLLLSPQDAIRLKRQFPYTDISHPCTEPIEIRLNRVSDKMEHRE